MTVVLLSLLYYSNCMEMCLEHGSEVENLLGQVMHLPDMKLVKGCLNAALIRVSNGNVLSEHARPGTLSISDFGPSLSRAWTREFQKYLPV